MQLETTRQALAPRVNKHLAKTHLPKALARFVEEQIKAGYFENRQEVLHEALREMKLARS